MNGIIHYCSHPNDDDPSFRISEEKIFSDIFHYLEALFRIIKPQKLLFMAVDGVAPRAKMNQQRGRRFRSAKDAEDLMRKVVKGSSFLSSALFYPTFSPSLPFPHAFSLSLPHTHTHTHTHTAVYWFVLFVCRLWPKVSICLKKLVLIPTASPLAQNSWPAFRNILSTSLTWRSPPTQHGRRSRLYSLDIR